ncbi:MAG: hypothetical protein OEZ43_21050 [Gammaproteobacteria bacterium]|nr:hypothetical protein [Gammaproteobacteria bacterium]
MPDYDMRDVVGRNQPQSTRFREVVFEVDYAQQNLAVGDRGYIGDLPAGFVPLGLVPISLNPEGEACTYDMGTGADPDGFAVDLNANTAANGQMAPGAAALLGQRLSANTAVYVALNAAQPLMNAHKAKYSFWGYMLDL